MEGVDADQPPPLDDAQRQLAQRLFEHAMELRRRFEYEAALNELRRAADMAHPEALFELGRATDYGELMLQEDHRESTFIFRRSGEAGYAPGLAHYASKMHRGFGVPVDRDEANLWANKALATGDTYALALCTYRGLADCRPDEELALQLYTQCAEAGFAAAQFVCGNLQAMRDRQCALAWFLKAAEQGYGSAQYRAGMLLIDNEATFAQGVRWLRESARQRYRPCMLPLARIYFENAAWRNWAAGADCLCRAAKPKEFLMALEQRLDLVEKALLPQELIERWQELYVYGKWFSIDRERLLFSQSTTYVERCVGVFQQSRGAALAAVMCLLGLHRRRRQQPSLVGTLPRDLVLLLARDLWTSRLTPSAWGVSPPLTLRSEHRFWWANQDSSSSSDSADEDLANLFVDQEDEPVEQGEPAESSESEAEAEAEGQGV